MSETPRPAGQHDRREHIASRAIDAGLTLEPDMVTALDKYLGELERWNRKINLTALPLDPATDAAIDRLVIEPLIAAQHVGPGDRIAIDIGSGGGSPAIPLTIAVPHLQMVMIEMRTRKCAFLRAVVREVAPGRATVENRRVGHLPGDSRPPLADLVTVRAVRAERELLDEIAALLRDGGRLFWFGAPGESDELPSSRFELESSVALPSASPSAGRLAIFRRIS